MSACWRAGWAVFSRGRSVQPSGQALGVAQWGRWAAKKEMLAGALLMTATGCRISKEDVLEEEVYMAVAVIMVNYIMSHRFCNSYL